MSNSKAPIAIKIFFALALLTLSIHWLSLQRSPKNEYTSISTLLHEFEKIPPPNYSKLIGESKNHKVSSAIVSAKYITKLTTEEVLDHYDSLLEESGWNRKHSIRNLIYEYCKEPLSASIEFFQNIPIYSFSITWDQSRLAGECRD